VSTLKLAPGLDLPVDAVTQKFAFLGRSGSGKTFAAGRLAESMLDVGAQVVVLDPVGVWWGLRVAADGKGPGISIPVFGGEHGDVPLEPEDGQLVADLIVDKGTSVVLDVSSFRKGQRKEFVTALAEQLFHRKKGSRSPIHLFLEEAQTFVPQRTFKGEERMLGAWEDICKLGRNYGIGFSLISQRPQAVNKDALNQAEVLVVLQTSGPQERKTIEGWIDEKGVDTQGRVQVPTAELSKLPVGTACVWSPQWLRILGKFQIAKKRTFDASATPTVGQKAASARTLAPVELDEIRMAMKQVVERAAARDPAALRKRIAELERDLAKKTAPTRPLVPERIPYVPPELLVEIRRLDHQVDQLQASLARTCEVSTAVQSTTKKIELLVERLRKDQPQSPARNLDMTRSFDRQYGNGKQVGDPTKWSPTEDVAAKLAEKRRMSEREAGSNGDTKLPKGARSMLVALATLHPRPLTRVQLGTLAGLSHAGGTFGNYLSLLRVGGYIDGTDEGVVLTPQGQAVAPATLPEIDLPALWKSRLPKGARDMLDTLLGSYPSPCTRDQLGKRVGIEPSGGTFGNYLSLLRTNGLVEVGRDGIRASETFFLGVS